MTTDEMKNKIKTVVCSGMSYGITVFACLKSDEGINLKKFLFCVMFKKSLVQCHKHFIMFLSTYLIV